MAGNGQITKKRALLEVGGWNENSATEDFDLTLRLILKKWKIKYCSDAVLWQEGIEKLLPLLRQRIRWASGLLSSFSDYFFSFIFQPLKIMIKLDALITLLRITIPFYIIFGYLLLLISLFFKWRFYFIIPEKYFLFTSLTFFSAMLLAIYRESPKFNLLRIKGKILRYWLFSFIWLLAVPIAFFNSFKNKNSAFFWDKTFHKGDFSLPLIKKEGGYNFSSGKNLINLQKDVLFK
ncbi:MAG: glycosyltransferase family 2 protein [Armatimonadetes bacterium]|nr:glycosyltransferase family 2 protein [Armatimonadota bacterium]